MHGTDCDMGDTDCDMGDTKSGEFAKKSKNSAFFSQNSEANCILVLYLAWDLPRGFSQGVTVKRIQFTEDEDLIDICYDIVFKAVFARNTPESQGALSKLVSAIIDKEHWAYYFRYLTRRPRERALYTFLKRANPVGVDG